MLARNVAAFIAALLCLLPSLAVGGDRAGSAGRLADLLPKHARWSLVVLDLQSGGEIAAMGNAQEEPLVPGSVAKLFVTGAVLDRVASGEGPAAFLPTAGIGRRGKPGKGGKSDGGVPRRARPPGRGCEPDRRFGAFQG